MTDTPIMADLFTGKLVRLAAYGTKDLLEAAARWSNDAEVFRLSDSGPAIPRGVAYFEEDLKEIDHDNGMGFCIRTIADDKLIGDIGLRVQWSHQSAWLGVSIGEPEYHGKGYGTEAVRLVVNYGFQELGLWRVQLGVFSYNIRAQKSYQKVGFRQEAIQRSALYRDGQRHDHILMGILRPEWEALRRAAAAQAE
jgi:RimJ/RimL family protein N-acetyltransferase